MWDLCFLEGEVEEGGRRTVWMMMVWWRGFCGGRSGPLVGCMGCGGFVWWD